MAYTTINKSGDYFNTKLYTGNGSTQSITGVGFQPDWIWNKTRSAVGNHVTFDAVRGTLKRLKVSTTDAETNSSSVTSFDSDGYTLAGEQNTNGVTYASWNWLANGAGSANTDGSISSTVSTNTTSGFSIVKWTGSGATATIGHGLGSVPKMIIVKNTQASENWIVYHSTLGSSKHLKLNLTDAEATTGGTWNHTNPTANVFTVHTNTNVNANGNSMIAYCFAEKQGYSKFGKYIGNGNVDGTFVYTGFKPAMIIIKKNGAGDNWHIYDNKVNPTNVMDTNLRPNLNDAEITNANHNLDFVSNGFKWRTSSNTRQGSGSEVIYMAFAESPLVTSTGIPTTAR